MKMKHLLLYEAFGSVAFSKTVNFLKKKFGSAISKNFVQIAKRSIEPYDLPIGNISDDMIDYVGKKQAFGIMSKEQVKNKWGVYCLKFWFSLEKGYLGYTGTGNQVIDFENWLHGKTKIEKETFNQEELDYIKNTLGITTGILFPVTDYSKLKLGDDVIGYFSKIRDKAFLSKAKIWTDEKHLKAIQNVAKGKDPKVETMMANDGSEVTWRNWGESSWGIGRVGKIAPDHLLLHHYIPDDKPLRTSEIKIKNPLDFNLPVKPNGTIGNWKEVGFSINDLRILDTADFAVILYVDKMMDNYPSINTIKSNRMEVKKNATKFMTDVDIKAINIKRYAEQLVSKMGIVKNTKALQNLQKPFLRSICGDFGFISLYKDVPSKDYINSFIGSVRKLLTATKATSDNKLKDVIEIFDYINREGLNLTKSYNESWEMLYNGNEQQKEMAIIIRNIGVKIKNHIASQNIQTLEDLKIIFFKIRSIRGFILDVELKFSAELVYTLTDFQRPDRTAIHCREFANANYAQDIQKLKYIERYVDSVTK